LVFLGAPGAGKGTQAQEIARRLGIPHISTGAIFRENVQKGTRLGALAKSLMEKGELVSDEVVNGMVDDRLRQADCAKGFLLDGYPRTVAQAKALKGMLGAMGCDSPIVVNLQVSYDIIVQRLSGRRNCPKCQRIYNLLSQPPQKDSVCDVDGVALEQRADDREEAIRQRLAAYEAQTAPLIDYYQSGGKLLQVNGEQAPERITEELSRLLLSA
jgi:adenylate kinase